MSYGQNLPTTTGVLQFIVDKIIRAPSQATLRRAAHAVWNS